MKQKTAMMEAFDHLKLWIDSGLSPDNWFKNYEASHLEKEKEQIMDAFEEAYFQQKLAHRGVERSKEYYSETYKQD